jgi:hypothetical protein
VLYVAVVVAAIPVVVGLALNTVLIAAERGEGQLERRHDALGARDARDAWDFTFQRFHDTGVWVLVQLNGVPPGGGAERHSSGPRGERAHRPAVLELGQRRAPVARPRSARHVERERPRDIGPPAHDPEPRVEARPALEDRPVQAQRRLDHRA